MDYLNPLPALVALLAALATASCIAKVYGTPPSAGRFTSIDGLRGYLAFFVFMHHACIWHGYVRTGEWKTPPSNLYAHFGSSSVALFFMITGFLFFSKLLDGRKQAINWTKLYVGRFLRLTPLYAFAVLLMLLIVATLSDGNIQDHSQTLKEVAQWLGFSIMGQPDIHGVHNTFVILAGVTWSLPYEWLFYISLPLLSLAVGAKPPYRYIALGLLSIAWIVLRKVSADYLLCFLGGMAASLLVRWKLFCRYANHPWASIVVLTCIAATYTLFAYTYGRLPLTLLFAAFALIAAGNSLFGTLTHSASRTLGEYAYGLYLLHGILLFVLFHFVLGEPMAQGFSALEHWLAVIALTPILVCVCALTYHFIERPAMQKTAAWTAWLQYGRRALRQPG